jgi:PAS domain S-box-containing protein
VIVEDIPNDPRWADYRELARQAGVQSCWSEPIKDPGGHLLGTFAMYYREIRAPRDWELKVIGRAAQIAGVAILRERVDQAIQLSEAHFRRLADAVPELVWSTDAAGQRDYHNERWLRYTGQSAKEALRGGWKAVLHPDDLARAQQAWQTALTAGQRFDVEYRLKNRTGQYRWHSTHVAPFRDEEGHIVKWFGTSIDIEDAKRAQLEREERSRQLSLDLKRLEAIVSQLPEGVMVEDAASGELTFRNAEVEHLLGQPLLAGDLKQAWMQQRSHASEAPALQEEWPLARAIRHGKATGAQEIEVVRQDGTRATLSCRAAPIRDEESNIVAGVITLTDVTESKRLKDEQQLLANVSRVLNSSLDFNETITQLAQLATNTIADGCVIDVVDGDAIRRVATAHREPRREDLLRELQERFAADWQSTRPAVEALRTGRAVLHSELTPEVRAHFAVNAAHGGLLEQLDARSVLCVPLICRDMTLGVITLFFTSAHKRFTQRDIPLASEIAYRAAVALDNARLYQQAQKAVRLRDEFMSIASHELKAPLTALKIQAFLSRRQFQANVAATPAGTQTTKLLDTFDRQIDRLTRLIDDMLDVSRLTTGHLTLQWEHFDACELAAEVLDRFSAQLAQTGGEARCISTEPIIGRWDRHRLDQVLTNLISNAIKYAPGKPIEVRVSGDAEKAWVEVRDFGPGLSPEDSERIFQRFERLAPGKSTGLGLGLYIARQIVEALNGRLWVDSQLGYGSKFIMELPRR